MLNCLVIKFLRSGVPLRDSSSTWSTNLEYLSCIVGEARNGWFEVKVFNLEANIHSIPIFLMIKKRDRCKYQFDGCEWINLSGADYLSDNDEFLMIFFGAIRLPKVIIYCTFPLYRDFPGLTNERRTTHIALAITKAKRALCALKLIICLRQTNFTIGDV